MLALYAPTVHADWFVLGPGLEENSFPKKAVFEKDLENVHSLSGGGMSSRQACIAAEDSGPPAKRQGRNVKPYPPRSKKKFFLFSFCQFR